MAELLVYSERLETARELVAGGRAIAGELGLGVERRGFGRRRRRRRERARRGRRRHGLRERGRRLRRLAGRRRGRRPGAGRPAGGRHSDPARLHAPRQGDGAAPGAEARRRLCHGREQHRRRGRRPRRRPLRLRRRHRGAREAGHGRQGVRRDAQDVLDRRRPGRGRHGRVAGPRREHGRDDGRAASEGGRDREPGRGAAASSASAAASASARTWPWAISSPRRWAR